MVSERGTEMKNEVLKFDVVMGIILLIMFIGVGVFFYVNAEEIVGEVMSMVIAEIYDKIFLN